MAGKTSPTLDLNESIRSKSEQVERFLAKARPRKRRLLNATLIGGSLSALLTAGPALGGKSFTDWLSTTFGLEAPAWRLLCAAAAMASFVATLATQFLRSHSVEENLAKAQMAGAKLEILLIGLASGQMDEKQVLSEYIRSVESLAFLQGEH
jgi:hypothetical protein